MNPEEALLNAPAQIRKAHLEAYDAKKRADGARFRLRLVEADVELKVRQATRDGKPQYRNEGERDAAARRLLEQHPEATHLRKEIAEEEALAQRIEAHVQYLRDVQSNARALVLSRSPSNMIFQEPAP